MKTDNTQKISKYPPGYLTSGLQNYVPDDTRILIIAGAYGLHHNFYFYNQQKNIAKDGYNIAFSIDYSFQSAVRKCSVDKFRTDKLLSRIAAPVDAVGSREIIVNARKIGQKTFCVGNADKNNRSTEDILADVFERDQCDGSPVDRMRQILISNPKEKLIYYGASYSDVYGNSNKDSVQSLFLACGIKTFTVAFSCRLGDYEQTREEICIHDKTGKTGIDTPDLTVYFPYNELKDTICGRTVGRPLKVQQEEWKNLLSSISPK